MAMAMVTELAELEAENARLRAENAHLRAAVEPLVPLVGRQETAGATCSLAAETIRRLVAALGWPDVHGPNW